MNIYLHKCFRVAGRVHLLFQTHWTGAQDCVLQLNVASSLVLASWQGDETLVTAILWGFNLKIVTALSLRTCINNFK